MRSCRKLLCFHKCTNMGTELCPKIQLCDFACLPVHLANHSACQGRQPRKRCEAAFTSAVWADMLQAQNPKFVKTGKIRTQLHPHGRLSRTAHLHRLITFHNQSTDISASEGRPLADFRRIGELNNLCSNEPPVRQA